MKKTPLEDWIKKKIGRDEPAQLTPGALAEYQLKRLQETIAHAREHSPYYRKHLASPALGRIRSLGDLVKWPFTTAEDLRHDPLSFLCGSQSDVARVVTLQTSGTSAAPKRLFFSDADLELTTDFFHHGMATLVDPGQRVLILLPGKLPGSVGDLLVTGLARMGVRGIVHGPVQAPETAISAIVAHRIDCLVGIPTQVLALARHARGTRIPNGRIKSVLLCTDAIPRAIVDAVHGAWGCAVFQHYGATEMGLGGGVECEARCGYHLREADLLFEIIDPDTGVPVSDGQVGEVVFTSLTRAAMPLIRYRTGDLAAFMTRPCPCGSVLRRMDRVQGRRNGGARLDATLSLNLAHLDEAIFAVPHVVNYTAEIVPNTIPALRLRVYGGGDPAAVSLARVRQAALQVPEIARAVNLGVLVVDPVQLSRSDWPTTGVLKRKIIQPGTRSTENHGGYCQIGS